MGARIVLIVLATLLALPLAPTTSPVEARKRARTVTRTYSNTAPLVLPDLDFAPISANLYPSPIVVGGRRGTIRDVNVTLNGLQHNSPDQVAVLLVGPRGQTAIVMADVGGDFATAGVSLRLDDEAAVALGSFRLQSGAYRPVNRLGEPIAFNDPAPTAGANDALSVFDGANPNGTWRLFVQDRHVGIPGAFAGGWELEITAQVKANKKKR
jgi:subtilisin-like proprotein convertase family protein